MSLLLSFHEMPYIDQQGSLIPPYSPSCCLPDCPTNVGKTPPPHRVEKNGGQALNLHQ